MKVICISGHKGTGKSALRDQLMKEYKRLGVPAAATSFASGLRDVVGGILKTSGYHSTFINRAISSPRKEDPLFADGLTGRDLLIEMSETIMKRFFGRDVWADATLRTIIKHNEKVATLVVIDDLRYNYELEYLRDHGCDVVVLNVSGQSIYASPEDDVTISGSLIDQKIHSTGTEYSIIGSEEGSFIDALTKRIEEHRGVEVPGGFTASD